MSGGPHPYAGAVIADIALQRIVSHGLAGPVHGSVRDLVAHLSAVQAQELKGAYVAVAARVKREVVPVVDPAGPAESSLADAFAERAVVRSWPMRGTLHLTTAEDLPWILGLTAARQHQRDMRRREQLGITAEMIERAGTLATDRLAAGPASRADLTECWDPIGAREVAGRVYHLIYHLSVDGVLVQGPQHPTRPSEQLFVAGREWLPTVPTLSREEALARWMSAYFRSHGPATAHDAAAWSGLALTDVRQGAAAAVSAGNLEEIAVEGAPHFRDPGVPDLLALHREEAARVMLLPGFDELMTGYRDRSATLASEHVAKVMPARNAVFRPTVVAGGRMVGTWARGSGGTVTATPFDKFAPGVAAALADAGVSVAG